MQKVSTFLVLLLCISCTVLADIERPFVIVVNNSIESVVLTQPNGYKISELKSGSRLRFKLAVGDELIVSDSAGTVKNRYTVTDAYPQFVFALKPREQDIAAIRAIEAQRLANENQKIEIARQTAADKRAAEEETAMDVYTGLFQMGGTIFFQETSHKKNEPAKWTLRSANNPHIVEQRFIEEKRSPLGVDLKHESAESYVRLEKDIMRTRNTATGPWQPMLMGEVNWRDRKLFIAEIKAADAEYKKLVAEQVEKQRKEVAQQKAQQKLATEKANAKSEPQFKITRAFETAGSRIVNTRPGRWEIWPNDDFDNVIVYTEVSRTADGLTLKAVDGDHGDIRIKRDHYEINYGQGWQLLDSDDVVGEWMFDSLRDLRGDRAQAKIDFNEKQRTGFEHFRGGDPTLITTLKSRPDFVTWLAEEQIGVGGRKRATTSKDEEAFKAIDTLETGYHILRMNPARPSKNGLRVGSLKLLDLDLDNQQFYKSTDLFKLLPLSLSTVERGDLKKLDTSEMFFNEFERSESESFNVSVGGEAGGKKKGGSGEVGYSNTKTKMNSNSLNETNIYSEIRAYYVDLVIDKEHLRLHDDFIGSILNRFEDVQVRGFNSSEDFARFFTDFGTHYANRAMIGGKAWESTTLKENTLSEAISESQKVSGEVSFPVKAVQVNLKGGYEKATEEKKTRGDSKSTTTMEQFGGSFVGSLEEWDLNTDDSQNMEPLRVMLYPIWDLIRPQLFPVRTEQEVAYIDGLRKRFQTELDNYIARETADRPTVEQVEPFVVEMKFEGIENLRSDDDEAFADRDPDVYGYVRFYKNGVHVATPWEIKEDQAQNFKQGASTILPADGFVRAVLVPEFFRTPSGGFSFRYPETKLKVEWALYDKDIGGDQTIGRGSHEYVVQRDKTFDYQDRTWYNKLPKKAGAGNFSIDISFYPYLIKPQEKRPSHPDWYSRN